MCEPSPSSNCTRLPSPNPPPLPLSLTVYALNLANALLIETTLNANTMLIGTTLNYYTLPVRALGRHRSEYCAIMAAAVRASVDPAVQKCRLHKYPRIERPFGVCSEAAYYGTYNKFGPIYAYCGVLFCQSQRTVKLCVQLCRKPPSRDW
jgi:hypothetical protein